MAISTPAAPTTAPALSRVYAARFVFAIAWAGIVLALASEIDPFVATLLVLYPVYDIVGLAADARLSGRSGSRSALHVNIALSVAAAVGLVVAVTSGIPAVLRVFGAWAVVAGLAQLVVALRRRGMGGQVPMVVSGAISVLAGGSFVAMASGDDPSLSALGGYALLGGVFFLVSSIALHRRSRRA